MCYSTRGFDEWDAAQVISLYDSVGWSVYTKGPAQLMRALSGSAVVACAWDAEMLVGLARVLSEGETIVYVQDILVRPFHQHRGVGWRLLQTALEPVAHVRQTVLLADDGPRLRSFYEANGFTETHDHRPPLRSFVKFRS